MNRRPTSVIATPRTVLHASHFRVERKVAYRLTVSTTHHAHTHAPWKNDGGLGTWRNGLYCRIMAQPGPGLCFKVPHAIITWTYSAAVSGIVLTELHST